MNSSTAENGTRMPSTVPTSRGWVVLRFVVAAILLTAACFKAHQLATTPSLGEGLLHARWFNILVVEFELFFGLWLISGLLQKLTWLASVGCFSVFAAVSLYKALAGEASCGCFGTVTINPWYTTILDLVLIGLLVRFRPANMRFHRDDLVPELPKIFRKKQTIAFALLWLLLVVPTTYAMVSVKTLDIAELGTEFVGADGRKTVVLEPQSWIGYQFPLVSYLEKTTAERIESGNWKVVLFHFDCEKCRHLIEAASRDDHCLFLEVPSGENNPTLFEVQKYATLSRERQWWVNTPVVISLKEGVVRQISSNIN